MLNIIFKNPDLAAQKLNLSKTSIYAWLSGTTPNVSTMMKLYEVYNINVSLEYMYDFFTLVPKLLVHVENQALEEMLILIRNSQLDIKDKQFLGEFFKAKIWKKINA